MKIVVVACVAFVLAFSGARAQQNPNPTTPAVNADAKTEAKKRAPIFRANKEQIKQAQVMLKQRGFYNGDALGKLDTDTRAGLKKYQEAEGLKVTGTLNRLTLEKMNIPLTDKQKAM